MIACPHCGFSPLPDEARRCSQCQGMLEGQPSPGRVRKATQIEAVETLRGPAQPVRTPTLQEAVRSTTKEKAQPYCPTLRPPLLLLCIADDGRDTGELIRVRGPRLVIGRSEGDVLIAHDNALSGKHVELVNVDAARGRWRIRDLDSANGTFVRVNAAILNDGQELLVGSHRLRFNAARGQTPPADTPQRNATQGWQAVTRESLEARHASFTLLSPHGEGARVPLAGREHWIGSDRDATISLADDPFVSGRHARLFEDNQGRWHVEDTGSLNGTWLRRAEVTFDSHAEFIAGEQRFLVRVLGHEDQAAG